MENKRGNPKSHPALLDNLARWLAFRSERHLGIQCGSPAFILIGLCLLSHHFFIRGVILGVGQQLDPDPRPNYRLSLFVYVAVWVVTFLADGMPQMILLMIMLNISWLYSCPKIPDPVMENRRQSLLLPVAMAAALFIEQYPLFAPYLIWVIGFYFLRSALRNQFWSKRLFFWRQAHLEAPYKLRPRLNYGVALSAIGRT